MVGLLAMRAPGSPVCYEPTRNRCAYGDRSYTLPETGTAD